MSDPTIVTNILMALLIVSFLALMRLIWGRRKPPPPVGLETDWKSLYLEEHRKFGEQFAMIEGIQGERDRWKNLFWQASGEHGVAQEYMVRVNQHFAKICGRAPDAKMPAMAKAFREKYGAAAKPEIEERISRGGDAGGASLARASAPPDPENAGEAAVVVAKPDPNA